MISPTEESDEDEQVEEVLGLNLDLEDEEEDYSGMDDDENHHGDNYDTEQDEVTNWLLGGGAFSIIALPLQNPRCTGADIILLASKILAMGIYLENFDNLTVILLVLVLFLTKKSTCTFFFFNWIYYIARKPSVLSN